MKLIQPSGDIIAVDEDTPDLLQASRVPFSLLGVISEMTLQVTDSYNLHERIWRENFESLPSVKICNGAEFSGWHRTWPRLRWAGSIGNSRQTENPSPVVQSRCSEPVIRPS